MHTSLKGGPLERSTMPADAPDPASASRTPGTGATVAVVILVATALLGTGAALDILPGPTEVLSVWMSETESSDFVLDTYDADIQGKHRVHVTFEVRNADDDTHRANVTVQLLGEDGHVLVDGDDEPLEETVDTGDVAGETADGGDGTYEDTVRFEDQDLVERYHSGLVTVDQRY